MQKRFEDGCHFYLSDGQVYLPSASCKELENKYPEMPTFFQFIRQMYKSHAHVNTQNFEWIWDKLRKHACGFIRVIGNKEYEDYFIVETFNYNNYEVAKAATLPPPATITSVNELKRFAARHGVIKQRFYKIYKEELHYNTHHFVEHDLRF